MERCITCLKQWRGLAPRDEKRAANERALVIIASMVLGLDSCEPLRLKQCRVTAEEVELSYGKWMVICCV